MRYYIDTEFIERGHEYPIELISLGMVREDGASVYQVLSDGWVAEHAGDWVKANVLPYLGSARCSRADLRNIIRVFMADDPKPEFWGYYCDYDWVVFCQLFGSMVALPKGFPMFCRDVKQVLVERGNPDMKMHVPQLGTVHNALDDARHIKAMHDWLLSC